MLRIRPCSLGFAIHTSRKHRICAYRDISQGIKALLQHLQMPTVYEALLSTLLVPIRFLPLERTEENQ